ncbi:MAG: fatty acyl-AMP ligase [Rhodospirillaceae bacterium]|nr:MAG: fatty acyl-AMP ligase [Rhodospirillaceae bacterium]
MQTSVLATSAPAAGTVEAQLLRVPTPSESPHLPVRLADFPTITAALDYAARGETGFNFYDARGTLATALPYRELRDQAVVMAGRLAGAGVHPGDRVALLAATGPDFLVMFFGCLYGAIIPVPLPLPTAFGRRENYVDQIRGQIKSSGARLVIGAQEFVPIVTEASTGLDLILVGTRADLNAAPERSDGVRPGGTDMLAYIQYSSGSTRFPTGVCVTHANLMANGRSMCRDGLKLRAGDRAVSWLPFFHDMGLVGFMLAPLVSQATVDYLATEDFARRPLTWLKLLSENGGTVSYAPSFGYELCARRVSTRGEGARGLDLSRWRVAGIGGEMIKPQVMLQFADAFRPHGFSDKAFCASYGLAECVLAATFAELGAGMTIDHVAKDALAQDHRAVPIAADAGDRARVFVACGKVVAEHQMEIRGPDGAVLGERQVGRVFFHGPSVMQGYFNDPDATAEALNNGWLDTGDLGYWIADELVIVGRAKDMLIINGRNIWPQDIEWTVEHMDGLRSGDSAAIVLTAEDGGDRPTILVQCRPTDAADRTRLMTEVRARVMEAVGVACEVVLVPPRSLPKTSSGKLARGKAKTLFMSGELTALEQP